MRIIVQDVDKVRGWQTFSIVKAGFTLQGEGGYTTLQNTPLPPLLFVDAWDFGFNSICLVHSILDGSQQNFLII